MEMTARESAQQLHELMKHIKSSFDEACNNIAFCEGEARDLYHALEFFEDDHETEINILRQLRDNRRRRREAKRQHEQWLSLYEIVMNPGDLPERVAAARRTVQAVMKTQALRRYTVKSRNDLQEQFNQAADRRGGSFVEK